MAGDILLYEYTIIYLISPLSNFLITWLLTLLLFPGL